MDSEVFEGYYAGSRLASTALSLLRIRSRCAMMAGATSRLASANAKMHRANTITASWHPANDADRAAVREQLDRVLASSLFSNSKRYPALLRHVVEEVLHGHTENLKERTLGIEVFKRDPQYDTNDDPVVRVTAGEIRKRLAQYYYEPDHEAEIHIELPSGSYLPGFRIPEISRVLLSEQSRPALAGVERNETLAAPAPQAATSAPAPDTEDDTHHRTASRRHWMLYGSAFALLVIGALAVIVVHHERAAPPIMDQFWGPIINSPGTALLCLGDRASWDSQRAAAGIVDEQAKDVTVGEYIQNEEHVVMTDVLVLNRLAATLQNLGKTYRIKNSSATNLSDLRTGPVVLIGGYNNSWTLRMTAPLRFSFPVEPTGGRIVDKQDPSQTSWTVPLSTPYRRLSEDYGIVARFKDPTTDQLVVVAAGLAAQGTIATGEMLSNPEYLTNLLQHAPKDWQNMNMEAVIATQVIDGKSGPPRVVAVHFW